MSITNAMKKILGGDAPVQGKGKAKKGGKGKQSAAAKKPAIPPHRHYVGGNWEKIGRLQYDYLLSRGLKPSDYLVDIACGSLRVGRFLIEYLEPEHYLGIEKEQWLVEAALKEELSPELIASKKPKLVVSSTFEFEKFGVKPNFAWAQSLFTHLTPPLIRMCLERLRANIAPNGVFYATFFPTNSPRENLPYSDDKEGFWYTSREMQMFGEETGWTMTYIGDWSHPRNQHMLEYRPA